MLKIYLVSALPVQPLSFSFSPSAPPFSSLFCFSVFSSFFQFRRLPFLLSVQRFSSFLLSSVPPIFLLISAPPFFLSKTCCPSLAQNVGLFSPKHLSFQPKNVGLFVRVSPFFFQPPFVFYFLFFSLKPIALLFSAHTSVFSLKCVAFKSPTLSPRFMLLTFESSFSSNLE